MVDDKVHVIVYEMLTNIIKYFTFDTITQSFAMDEYMSDLSKFQVQGAELSLSYAYNAELSLQYIAMITLRGIYKIDFDPFTKR